MDSTTHSSSLAYVESLLEDYLADPESVPEHWQRTFAAMLGNGARPAGLRIGPSFQPTSLFGAARGNGARPAVAPSAVPAAAAGRADPGLGNAELQHRVDQLVRNYRLQGHRVARVDPISPAPALLPDLDPHHLGISDADLDLPLAAHHLPGPAVQTVREIVLRMRDTYCQWIGVEYMHITTPEIRSWLQQRMEIKDNRARLSQVEQRFILQKLTGAVVLENFIQKKYLGAKSFSLEGAETLIPLLGLAIEKAGRDGVREIILGMAHRGRLNVLTNIMGKPPLDIFREFEDVDPDRYQGRGDVKYHLGFSSDVETTSGAPIHLSLCFNPSHLEYINPVALGRVRSKQDRFGPAERRSGFAILIHGDAAFAGEGIVQETLNLSQLPGYWVGGTLHVIVNNQIGFTTSPDQARSNAYATDIAKMLEIPIFHVNGEDPEAVAEVLDVALEFRNLFRRDVVIDMYCYRRRGHNEGDEPAFTQPLMYKNIRARRPVSARYLEHLLTLGGITREEAEALIQAEEQRLERDWAKAKVEEKAKPQAYEGLWRPYRGGADRDTPDVPTGVEEPAARVLLERLAAVPTGFTVNSKIERVLASRREMARGERPLDWAAAEALAFASLAASGTRVRLTGQDTERGTFSHRHAVLHDAENGQRHAPLQHLAPGQAPVEIHNSPLSEAGALGFEFGYSLDCPDGLVLWEAQFGDFVNAAQVIIDQFLAAAEEKWHRLSGLVLLLPHGFEGQGPEHSSARVERFLQVAAEDNIQVAYPTTPAQYFHLLRRQVLRPLRKPLVVLTPKGLLRHAEVVSPLADCARGTFERVLPDASGSPPRKTRRILLCTGKVFFDLRERARALGAADLALVRLEQLYPVPMEALESALRGYPKRVPITWLQEEPFNMGAWPSLRLHFGDQLLGHPFDAITRPESASPATGSTSAHRIEQQRLLERALAADSG